MWGVRIMAKPARDEKYLRFIRTFCCIICQARNTVPHHFGRTGKGMGQKCSDYETIPLCVMHHNSVHSIGNKKFQELHCVDFERSSKAIYKSFMTYHS